jgi:hypothetical protein
MFARYIRRLLFNFGLSALLVGYYFSDWFLLLMGIPMCVMAFLLWAFLPDNLEI